VRAHIAEASVIEIDSAAFEFHQGDDGWRWRLVDEAGTELAESIATFPTRAEAQEELSVVKEFGPDSEISDRRVTASRFFSVAVRFHRFPSSIRASSADSRAHSLKADLSLDRQ